MKLPDFRLYEPLNILKERMGIPRDEYGSITVVVAAGGLTVEQLKALYARIREIESERVGEGVG